MDNLEKKLLIVLFAGAVGWGIATLGLIKYTITEDAKKPVIVKAEPNIPKDVLKELSKYGRIIDYDTLKLYGK